MQKETGIVMKVDGPNAIVMTADRRFLKVPAQSGVRIGQEIEVNQQVSKHRAGWTKAGVLAASVVLMAGIWQLSANLQPVKASAYIAVDINPSIELSVDKEKDVLQIIPLNDDGKKLIDHLDYKGKYFEQVIADLTGEAAKQGYIKPDGEILVTASDAGSNVVDIAELEKEAITTVQSALRQTGIDTNVGGVLVSSAIREQAKQLGVSPGKYALYLQAQERQIPITIEDLKKQSVSAIAQQHGTEIRDIVRNMDGGKKLDQLLSELKQKPAATQASDDKKTDVKQENNDNNRNDNKDAPKDDKKDDKQHPSQSNGKKPQEGSTAPASRDGINEPRYKNKDTGEDEDKNKEKKFDFQNRIVVPNLPGISDNNKQGEDVQDREESNTSTLSPRVPLGPSFPFLEVTLSLNTRFDKKAERSKKYNKDQAGAGENNDSHSPNGKKDKKLTADFEKK